MYVGIINTEREREIYNS